MKSTMFKIYCWCVYIPYKQKLLKSNWLTCLWMDVLQVIATFSFLTLPFSQIFCIKCILSRSLTTNNCLFFNPKMKIKEENINKQFAQRDTGHKIQKHWLYRCCFPLLLLHVSSSIIPKHKCSENSSSWNRAGLYGPCPTVSSAYLLSENQFNQKSEKTQKQRKTVKGDQIITM